MIVPTPAAVRVEFTCPACNRVDHAMVSGKDTVVCDGCRRPLELYPDGRIQPSPLAQAEGIVDFTDRSGRQGWWGRKTMRTKTTAKRCLCEIPEEH